MYKVIIENNGVSYTIHSVTTNLKSAKLSSAKIVENINSIGSLSFDILPNNIGFTHLIPFVSKISVLNTKTGQYTFKGRVLNINPKMDSKGLVSKSVTCEDRLGYLCDSIQPYTEVKTWKTDNESTGFYKYISYLLDNHNKQVDEYKRIYPGVITGPTLTENDNVTKGTNYETTWNCIKSKILDDFGGEIRLRENNNILYLDIVKEIGTESETVIEIGKNQKSLEKSNNFKNIFTRIIPLGAKIKKKDGNGNDIDSEERMTISSVNFGKIWLDTKETYTLGIITKVVEFDNITAADNLLKKAREYIDEQNTINESYKLSAVDLSIIDNNYDEFKIGNYHQVKNSLLEINKKLRIIKRTIDICKPTSSSFEVGDSLTKLSDIANQRANDIANILQQITNITSNYVKNEALTNSITNISSLINQKYNEIILQLKEEYVSNNSYEGTLEKISQIELLINKIQLLVSSVESNVEERVSSLEVDLEKINASIKDINSEAETIAKINVSLNEIQEQLSLVTDITTSDKGVGKVELTGVLYSELLRLEIHPTKEDISYLYHSKDLYHSENLYFLSRDVIFKGNNNETKFTLPCNLLIIEDGENSVYDEFVLGFDNQEMYCLHRIGINEQGQKYVLDKPYIEYFEYEPIVLLGDTYEVKMLSFPNAYIYARALASNIYTSQYATHYELNSSINIMQRNILGTVSEKITLVNGEIKELSGELDIQASQVALKLNSSDFTSKAIIGLINNRDGTSTGLIDATNINLRGYVTLTNLATDGQTTINGSNITTGTIDANRVNVVNLNANNITSGTISCNRLSGGMINGQYIYGGTINGSHIICNSGSIGGANINGYGMYFDNGNTGWGLWGTTAHANIVFHAGANTSNIGGAPFRIYHDGSFFSNRATISGTIYSSSGNIGGWSITGSTLEVKGRVMSYLRNNGNVLFGGNYGMINFDNNPVRITTASKMIISDRYNNATLSSRYPYTTIGIYADYGWLHLVGDTIIANNQPIGSSSSRATKKHIKIMTKEEKDEIYNAVNSLKSYSYDYKNKYGGFKNNYGFIIEDFEDSKLGKVLHCAQDEKNPDKKTYSHEDLTRINTILIQELMKKIEILEKKVMDNG